jgi:hypothetical protein
MTQRGTCHPAEMQTVRLAATIFAPSHLVCVLVEVPTADPVMDAVFRAAQPTN